MKQKTKDVELLGDGKKTKRQNMNVFQRHENISIWKIVAFCGSIASIIGLVSVFLPNKDKKILSINESQNTTVQSLENSPNSIQISNEGNINIEQNQEVLKLNKDLVNLQIQPILNYSIHFLPPFILSLNNDGNIDVDGIALYVNGFYYDVSANGDVSVNAEPYPIRNPSNPAGGSVLYLKKLNPNRSKEIMLDSYLDNLVKKRKNKYVLFKVRLFYKHPVSLQEYSKYDDYDVWYSSDNRVLSVNNLNNTIDRPIRSQHDKDMVLIRENLKQFK